MRSTGAVAQCIMAYWHKELVKKLKIINIDLDFYEGYVDDITLVTDELENDTVVEDNKLVAIVQQKGVG